MSIAPISDDAQGAAPQLRQAASQMLIQGFAGKILANAELPPIAQQAASMAIGLAQGSLEAGAGARQAAVSNDVWQIPSLLSQLSADPEKAIGLALAGSLPSPSELQQRVQNMIGRGQPAEYEIVDGGAAPETARCRRTGMGFLFQPANVELDALMSLPTDAVPTSVEVLPHISLDAPMTEQGVLEAIASLYPAEAWQLLYILGPRGAGGGLGYKLHFLDAAATYPQIMKSIEDTRRDYNEGISRAESWRQKFNIARSRDQKISADRHYAEKQLNDWLIDDKSREIFIGNWAEGSVFGDLWQDRDLTNRKGAELLRALIAQHFYGEETFWQTTARLAIGTGLVVFGTMEIVAGVSLASGGTAASLGTATPLTVAGGVALTAVGADQVVQGNNMLVSPDPEDHYGPIGALVNHLGKSAGGKSGGQVADFSWTAIQILVSLGGAFSATKLAREIGEGAIPDGTVFRTLSNAPSRMEYHAFKVEDYPLNHFGQTADVTPSLAGRGLFAKLDEGAEFLIESGEHADGELLRVLLRARTLDNMAALAKSAGRRLQALGAKSMSPAQRNAIDRGAAEYGAKVERLSPRQFDERVRAAGGKPERIAAAFDNSSGALILRQDATYYEAFHELQHARQWSELGPEAYGNLSRLQRERYVFDRVLENADDFSSVQLGHAGDYLISVGRRAGIGLGDLNLPANFTRSRYESYLRFISPSGDIGYEQIAGLDRIFGGVP